MSTSLEDALNGKPGGEAEPEEAKAETPPPTEEPQPEVTAEPEAPKEPEKPVEAEPPEGYMPYGAYKGEKTKRQELEKTAAEQAARLEEAERQVQEMRHYFEQQQQQQTNPEQYQIQQQFGQQLQQQAIDSRLHASEFAARSVHGDDVVNAALEALQGLKDNGATKANIKAQSHPWDAMVKWHKRHQTIERLGDDPDAYIKQQIEAGVKAALEQVSNIPPPQTTPQAAPQTPVMPTDLSQTRNVGTRTGSNWTGPTDLSSALGEKS